MCFVAFLHMMVKKVLLLFIIYCYYVFNNVGVGAVAHMEFFDVLLAPCGISRAFYAM